MDYETATLEKDYNEHQSKLKKLENENKHLRSVLQKIASQEENFKEPNPEYFLLKCCALAKDALSKLI